MKRITEDPHRQCARARPRPCSIGDFLHRPEALQQCGQCNRQLDVLPQPAQILERVGNALQEMRLALIEAAKAVRAQRLHDPDVDERVVVLHELCTVRLHETCQHSEVVVQQLLAQLRRQRRFAVVEERSHVILQRALTSSVIQEKGWPSRSMMCATENPDRENSRGRVEQGIS